MLLEKLSLETSSKKFREKWSLTTPVQKCGLNHYHLKRLSKKCVAKCCRKILRKSVAKNNCTEILLRTLPLRMRPKSTKK